MREDGTLKDASEMEWLHSPSNEYNRSFATQDEDQSYKNGSGVERPNSSSEYNGAFELGDTRKCKHLELNESESEAEEAPKAKVSYNPISFFGTY